MNTAVAVILLIINSYRSRKPFDWLKCRKYLALVLASGFCQTLFVLVLKLVKFKGQRSNTEACPLDLERSLSRTATLSNTYFENKLKLHD